MDVATFSHKKHQWRNRAYRLLEQSYKLPDAARIVTLTKPERFRLYTLARRMQTTLQKGEELLNILREVPYQDPARVQGEIEDTQAQLVDAMTTLEDLAEVLGLARFPAVTTRIDDESKRVKADVAAEALQELMGEAEK